MPVILVALIVGVVIAAGMAIYYWRDPGARRAITDGKWHELVRVGSGWDRLPRRRTVTEQATHQTQNRDKGRHQ